jgi:uncharacterized protein (TIGR01777 family)
MKVLVVGASGFIGTPLVEALLERGDEVVAAARNGARLRNRLGEGVTGIEWDGASGPLPAEALAGVDGVINLAGDPVDKGRWNKGKKGRIRESRIATTRHLVEAMAAAEPKPAVLVNGSAIGIYGDRKHLVLTENSAADEKDFLAGVCREWEAEAAKAREAGIRVAIVRTGVVLSKKGGAYPKMSRPFRFGLGGRIGLGKAWMGWIHLDDIVGIFLHCLDSESARHVYNGVSPNPVPNEEFTSVLASVLRVPALAWVPPIALRVLYGEFANVITASAHVTPLRTLAIGYEYQYPELRGAIENLEAKRPVPDEDDEPEPEPTATEAA